MNSRTRRWPLPVLLLAIVPACATRAEQEANLPTRLQLEPVAEGFTAPHYLVTPPEDPRRFVLDLVGQITIMDEKGLDEKGLDEKGTPRPEPFLDLSDRMATLSEAYDERGLLGLAFHPDYQQNGRFFVCYSAPLQPDAPSDWDHTTHISEFRVSDDPNRADPESERVLMQIDQPQMNHNGGRIVFGPDGYLYVGLGDGGSAGDLGDGHPSLGNGQDITTLNGSVLRIDVNEEPYAVPDDNPLVGQHVPGGVDYSGDAVREEIWAWGIRNAWGMTFDRQTGDLYLADVGQDLWEEVNVITQPGNYGWNLKEGTHGFDTENMQRVIDEGPDTGPMGEPLIDPVIEYRNARGHGRGVGISVIGGHVYRGAAIEPLQGHYLFGDWTSGPGEAAGVVLVSRPDSRQDGQAGEDGQGNRLWPLAVAVEHDQYILGFGEDADGELYVLTSDERGPAGTTGRIFQIVHQE